MKFIVGIIIGVLLCGAAGFGYFLSGSAPVAVADKTMPFEKLLANGALHARIDKEMPKNVPVTADENTYVAAAKIYVSDCAVCHGFPNRDQGPIAKGCSRNLRNYSTARA